MIGRTITGVEQVDDYHWLLRLDDGTAVELAAQGYEIDETTVTHLTPEVLRRREIEAEEERRERAEETERRRLANERKQAHIAEMRQKLDPDAFEKWRRKTYPELSETLKDVWTGPALQGQLDNSYLLPILLPKKDA